MAQNNKFFEKHIKQWLKQFRVTGNTVSLVDEGVISLTTLAVALKAERPVLIELPGYAMGEKVKAEMELWAKTLGIGKRIEILPDGTSCGKKLAEAEIPRATLLNTVLHAPPDILLASSAAVMSPAPPPEKMRSSELTLKKGMELPLGRLAEMLVEMDYDDEPEVTQPGEFSRRGGLIDIFSPAQNYPARIEYWGDTIDSIRQFTPETQRAVREISEYKLIMRSGSEEEGESDGKSDFTDYVRLFQPMILRVFPEESRKSLERFFDPPVLDKWEKLKRDPLWNNAVQLLDVAESAKLPPDSAMQCPVFPSSRHILHMVPQGAEENLSELVRQISSNLIRQLADESYKISIAGRTEGDLLSLRDWLRNEGLDSLESIECIQAEVPCGIFLPDENFALFSEYELFSSPRRLLSHKTIVPEIEDDTGEQVHDTIEEAVSADMEEGDYAVHINYGICIYHGLKTIHEKDRSYEALDLEFDNDSRVYVPIWQAHCVSRYIGSQKGTVRLSRIGSSKWNKIKSEAAGSVRSLALDMLRIHAMRCQAKGCSFPQDDLQQRLFEKSFPFTETRDQLRAAEEIKRDMESPRPMDRLLCGDVGYGKTEVAMRAIFKCVMSGKQAAILVPTTVLAQQHYYNFLERFAEYPFIIETLSRFKTKGEQAMIVERMNEGKVDIVIGTHRLLQSDVKFKNLGLVVVDEEQRFGVVHKEKLKNLRTTVDVLTMTATPIPRTLYFSMSGMRDLSTIMSAPVQRLPVHTVVSQYDDSIVAAAITRELQRGGQVYYLHNRVGSIDETAERLKALVPQAKFGIGHGQMNETELEDVMSSFIEGRTDVLVCTTIIESGLDIPNANTIIIERADRFGLAELYQLRGRVGRWSRQAYAYLLLPRNSILTGNVRKRIAAMRKYTHLGSGFKLALRDLEIRGAGNILGAEQSGHINAIGFNLYCQLLRTVTSRLKGVEVSLKKECNVFIDFVDYSLTTVEGKIPAAFPEEYINSPRLRLDAYRRVAMINDLTVLESYRQELQDRFGRLPRAAENLFVCAGIRIIGILANLDSISCADDKIILERAHEILKPDGKIPRLPSGTNPDSKLRFMKMLLEKIFLKK